MTTKHEIEVDLPEGWRAVICKIPKEGIDYILYKPGVVKLCDFPSTCTYLIVQKIKPRRYVLEETDEIMTTDTEGYVLEDGERITWIHEGITISPPHKIWREVKDGE